MPILLAPLWLAALAALALPIALHLRRRRSGPTVAVGSTRWLADSTPPRRSRRLTQPWLLLLRLLIVTLGVLLAARPVVRRAAAASSLLLVSPEALRSDSGRRLADSLSRGRDVRMLTAGLPRFTGPSDSALTPAPVWPLLRQADATLGAGSRIIVIAPVRTDRLGETRPSVHAELAWLPVPPAGAGRWLAGGQIAGDSLRAVVRWSAPGGVRSAALSLPNRTGEWPTEAGPLLVTSDSSGTLLRLGDDSLRVQQRPRSVAVFAAPDRSDEAGYLTAAITAASLAGGPAPRFQSGSPDSSADWIAWLNSGTLPHWLRDRAAAGATVITAGEASGNGVLLRAGSTVLGRIDSLGRGRLVRLDHQLRPAEASWVLSAAFPTALATLWAPDTIGPDPRPVSLAQALPQRALGAATPAQRDITLAPWIAGIVILLLLAERVAARRSRV